MSVVDIETWRHNRAANPTQIIVDGRSLSVGEWQAMISMESRHYLAKMSPDEVLETLAVYHPGSVQLHNREVNRLLPESTKRRLKQISSSVDHSNSFLELNGEAALLSTVRKSNLHPSKTVGNNFGVTYEGHDLGRRVKRWLPAWLIYGLISAPVAVMLLASVWLLSGGAL